MNPLAAFAAAALKAKDALAQLTDKVRSFGGLDAGMSVLTQSIRMLASVVGVVLTPFNTVLAAGVVTLADMITAGLTPSLEALMTASGQLLNAFLNLVS